jgi:hypothetical protein
MIAVMTGADPAAFFREMLGQWEAMTNQFGTELMKSGEFARTMQGATTASLKMQEAAKEAMGKALAAANMPCRDDVFDLARRLSAVEGRLERIEALLVKLAGPEAAAPAQPARPKPARTRKPPQKP